MTGPVDPPSVLRAVAGRSPGRAWTADGTGGVALALAARGWQVEVAAPLPVDRARVELALASLAELDARAARALWGLGTGGRRVWLYHALRGRLSPEARTWWDAHEEQVRSGILLAGRREREDRRAARILAALLPSGGLRALREAADPPSHRSALEATLLGPRGRLALRLSHPGGGRVPRAARLLRAASSAPLPAAPLVERALFGGWTGVAGGPAWLSPEGWEAMRAGAEKIRVAPGASPTDTYDLLDAGLVESSRPAPPVDAWAQRIAPGGILLAFEAASPLPPVRALVEQDAHALFAQDASPDVSQIRMFRRE